MSAKQSYDRSGTGNRMSTGATEFIEIRQYTDGEVIFNAGEPSQCMYEIQHGQVEIYLNYGRPDQKLLSQLGKDAMFGEMGMLEGVPRSATAVAKGERVEISEITWPLLGKYFKTKPSKIVMMMQQISDRLRLANEQNNAARTTIELALKTADEQNNLGAVRRVLQRYVWDNQ